MKFAPNILECSSITIPEGIKITLVDRIVANKYEGIYIINGSNPENKKHFNEDILGPVEIYFLGEELKIEPIEVAGADMDQAKDL